MDELKMILELGDKAGPVARDALSLWFWKGVIHDVVFVVVFAPILYWLGKSIHAILDD